MQDLSNKRAIITGAASGIGRAIAVELAAEGAHVCLWDRDHEGLQETAIQCRELGAECICRVLDLASSNEITLAVQDVLSRWPAIDILVNNAGVGFEGPTQRMTPQQWHAVMGINLLAPVQIIHELLPALLARPEAHILNVSSMLGLCPAPRGAAYCTTKYALVGLSESLRVEYRRTRLGVTVVCPGFVRTQLFANGQGGDASLPIKKPSRFLFTSPDYVARKAVLGLKRNRGKVLVTPLARFLWLANRYMPSLIELASMIGRRKGPSTEALYPLAPYGQCQ